MKPTSELLPSPVYSTEFDSVINQNVTGNMDAILLDGALSSIVVLIMVLSIICTLVVMSLLTYCFHKWKLRARKLQRAQEEYQKDQEKNMSPCKS
ncbi:hypothetical protein XELAEV_18042077mg [Xenopus laevis]|uniref:Uncharacterized protein n=1 Tax=Xenopus laevis TaxID=8355 RepID=A0A974C3D5_XENLA|nr:hypothetical protein XELAEV_18042077mg [Xenopus laevis]